MVGTTNRPDRLDEAVLRRMPRRLLIDLPQEHERQQILRTLLVGEALSPCVDTAAIAAASAGYSGSDLKNLCIKAAFQPVRSLLEREQREQREQGEQGEQREQPAIGAARAQRGGAAALRAIVMDDFELAKQTLRVSTAMDTPARESMMRCHGPEP